MGKVLLNGNTEKELTSYFKKKYDLDVQFMFCHISYQVKYLEYESPIADGKPVQESITAHVPILVVANNQDDTKLTQCLKVEEPIDIGSNKEFDVSGIMKALEEILPEGVILLEMDKLTKAMNDLGYEEFAFEFQNLGSMKEKIFVTRGTAYKKEQIDSNLSQGGNYIDKKDQMIQEKMKREGKVKINQQFRAFVCNYYKQNYDLDGSFEFLPVEYQFFDLKHEVYGVDEQQYVKRPEKRKVKSNIACFVTEDGYPQLGDLRGYKMVIPDMIEEENLLEEVQKRLPSGVTVIPTEKIEEILNQNGYEEPFFDHYFYSMMDRPDFNIYARSIILRERNENIPQMIEDYYRNLLKQDIILDLIEIELPYTYMSLKNPVIDLNHGGVTKYYDERRYLIHAEFVPTIIPKDFYEKNFSDDDWDYKKRSFRISKSEEVDMGSCVGYLDNYYAEKFSPKLHEILLQKVSNALPKECQIVTEDVLKMIANNLGYDSIEWKVYDKSPYPDPEWITEYYGIRKRTAQLSEEAKKSK